MKKIINLLLVVMVVVSVKSLASDLEKEKRWADQIVDAVFDGEVISLNDGKADFMGIYTEAEENQSRGVIVMHGTGVHPDWQQVIQPLRVGLTEYNWHTLSIQMPILANDAQYSEYAPLYDEVAPRVDEAIKYLHTRGVKNIVFVAHSQGAAMAAYYLASTKASSVKGFVAIGLVSSSIDPRMNSINSLKNIAVPVLDLYGNDDLDGVISSAKLRTRVATESGNDQYTQIKIAGNHFFDDQEAVLIDTVAEWLQQLKLNL